MKSDCVDTLTKGRPREFGFDDALAAALRVFWRNGYESATMADLTAEMGIAKPSLYAAFGNKEALFNKALDLYEREKLAYMTSALSAPTARGVAERLLRGALEIQTSTCNPKGCLGVIAASACGAEAESIKAHVIARRASSEAAVVRRFEVARDAGELPETLQPQALARYLFALMQGLAIQGGSGISCEDLNQLVDTSMEIWPTQ
jgi:AcrR family transcriptional regulator